MRAIRAALVIVSGCLLVETAAGGSFLERLGLGRDRAEDAYEYHFVIEVGGRLRTTGHTIQRPISYRGLDCLESVSTQKTVTVREEREYVRRTEHRVITGPDGEGLYSKQVTLEGDSRVEETVLIEDGVARFTVRGSADKDGTEEIDVPEGVLLDTIDVQWLADRDLEPGATYQAPVLNRRRREVLTETAKVVRLTKVEFLGDIENAWVVETTNPAMGQRTVTKTFTPDGRLVRLDAGEASLRVLSPEAAEEAESEPAYEVRTGVPVDFELPAWDSFDAITVQPQPETAWDKLRELPENRYSQLVAEPAGLSVRLRKVSPAVPAQASFPVEPGSLPAQLEPFLGTSERITPDAEEIRQRAEDITEGETEALYAVAYLAGWIHENIKWNAKGRMNTRPAETLERRRGDCSEHADLFASMARAVNIPTRHCAGLLLRRERAVYHTWVEAYVGETWVPVDTTVNRVNLPAGYLLTVRDEVGDGELVDWLPIKLQTEDLSLSIVEATKLVGQSVDDRRSVRAYTLVPNNKKSYVAFRDDWLANLLWGFALTKPPDWDGRIAMRSVVLTSPPPQQEATFRCEANAIEYRANKIELDTLVRALEERMTGFRKQKAEVVQLHHRPALYVDFTCTVGNGEERKAMRCRQYVVPRRDRSYRISCWAPEDTFGQYEDAFGRVLASLEL